MKKLLAFAAGIAIFGATMPVAARSAENGQRHGEASWYSTEACRFNRDSRCPTASGDSLYQLQRDHVPYAAMWDVPLHSRWQVCGTAGCATVVALDRGPNRRLHRLIDLNPTSYQAACGSLKQGVCRVTVERLP